MRRNKGSLPKPIKSPSKLAPWTRDRLGYFRVAPGQKNAHGISAEITPPQTATAAASASTSTKPPVGTSFVSSQTESGAPFSAEPNKLLSRPKPLPRLPTRRRNPRRSLPPPPRLHRRGLHAHQRGDGAAHSYLPGWQDRSRKIGKRRKAHPPTAEFHRARCASGAAVCDLCSVRLVPASLPKVLRRMGTAREQICHRLESGRTVTRYHSP
jgi:hypothetical protein